MPSARLTSFTQVPGWREEFERAKKRLSETRTDSLFPEIPEVLCGETVRAFSLRDWTIMEQAGNPLVSGGHATADHASNVLWLLRAGWRARIKEGRLARFLRAFTLNRVLQRYNYDELAVVADVATFIDDALLDMPGRSSRPAPFDPTKEPRFSSDINICGEIMGAFPAFDFHTLHTMPLAQLWQWLHRARKLRDPEYRNDQITDEINRKALGEKNRINEQLKAAQKAA